MKITRAGQPCRKCQTPVIQKTPRRKIKPRQPYYFEWYLLCPGCKTMYMVDAAKRMNAPASSERRRLETVSEAVQFQDGIIKNSDVVAVVEQFGKFDLMRYFRR